MLKLEYENNKRIDFPYDNLPRHWLKMDILQFRSSQKDSSLFTFKIFGNCGIKKHVGKLSFSCNILFY